MDPAPLDTTQVVSDTLQRQQLSNMSDSPTPAKVIDPPHNGSTDTVKQLPSTEKERADESQSNLLSPSHEQPMTITSLASGNPLSPTMRDIDPSSPQPQHTSTTAPTALTSDSPKQQQTLPSAATPSLHSPNGDVRMDTKVDQGKTHQQPPHPLFLESPSQQQQQSHASLPHEPTHTTTTTSIKSEYRSLQADPSPVAAKSMQDDTAPAQGGYTLASPKTAVGTTIAASPSGNETSVKMESNAGAAAASSSEQRELISQDIIDHTAAVLTSSLASSAIPSEYHYDTATSSSLLLLSGKKGFSCHQCKTSKDSSQLLFCINKAEKGKRKRNCRKKYCDACLRRAYNVGIENFTPEQRENWQCPACQGRCVCASCSRKHDSQVVTVGQKLAAMHAAATAAAQFLPTTFPLHQQQINLLALNNQMQQMRGGTIFHQIATPALPVVNQMVMATAVNPVVPGLSTSSSHSSISSGSSQNESTSAAVTVATEILQSHSTPPLQFAPSHPPTVANAFSSTTSNVPSAVVLANVVPPPPSLEQRTRAYSCPASPSSRIAGESVDLTTTVVPPQAQPISSVSGHARSRKNSLVEGNGSGSSAGDRAITTLMAQPRENTPLEAGLPQRHRRHSLKGQRNPFEKKRSTAAVAKEKQQMRNSQHAAQSQHQQYRSLQPQHYHPHQQQQQYLHQQHSDSTDMSLPGSFSQGMSISSQQHGHHYHQQPEAMYMHSAPVSPSAHRRNRPGGVWSTAVAVPPLDTSSGLSSASNTPQLSPSRDVSMSMRVTPPSSVYHPLHTQLQPSLHSSEMLMLHSPPNLLANGMNISPHQNQHQHLLPSSQHNSPNVSPHTRESLLATYLQQQAQLYEIAQSGGGISTADMDFFAQHNTSLFDALQQRFSTNQRGFDSSSVVTSSDDRFTGVRDSINLQLNLSDPTETLNTINALQATLQQVIQSKQGKPLQQQQQQQHQAMQHYQHQSPQQQQHQQNSPAMHPLQLQSEYHHSLQQQHHPSAHQQQLHQQVSPHQLPPRSQHSPSDSTHQHHHHHSRSGSIQSNIFPTDFSSSSAYAVAPSSADQTQPPPLLHADSLTYDSFAHPSSGTNSGVTVDPYNSVIVDAYGNVVSNGSPTFAFATGGNPLLGISPASASAAASSTHGHRHSTSTSSASSFLASSPATSPQGVSNASGSTSTSVQGSVSALGSSAPSTPLQIASNAASAAAIPPLHTFPSPTIASQNTIMHDGSPSSLLAQTPPHHGHARNDSNSSQITQSGGQQPQYHRRRSSSFFSEPDPLLLMQTPQQENLS